MDDSMCPVGHVKDKFGSWISSFILERMRAVKDY